MSEHDEAFTIKQNMGDILALAGAVERLTAGRDIRLVAATFGLILGTAEKSRGVINNLDETSIFVAKCTAYFGKHHTF